MLFSTIDTFLNAMHGSNAGIGLPCYIVGFSGGVDSTVLLDLMYRYCKNNNSILVVAHFNHQWRKEADDDAAWCAARADHYGIAFHGGSADAYKNVVVYNGSKEAHARAMRRIFFTDVARQYANSYIVLAHTQDDQYENFFIRLARGATVSGLSGIRPVDKNIVRPLLGVTKADIMEYASYHALEYRHDSTNESLAFLRNKIRHQVVPVLDHVDKRFRANTLRTIEHFAELEEYLETVTRATLISIGRQHAVLGIGIHVPDFLALARVMQYRVLLAWCIRQKIPFEPSTALLAEIIRFMGGCDISNKSHLLYNRYILLYLQESKAIYYST